MPLNPLNHHYAMENPASIYDEEAMTALELAGRTTAKVNETVKAFNELEGQTNAHLDNQDVTIATRLGAQDKRLTAMEDVQIPATVTDEMQERINDGTFDRKIDQYAGDLTHRLDNLLGQVVEGTTSGDAELIDGRTNEVGQTHSSVGNAIRRTAGKVHNLESVLLVKSDNLIDPATLAPNCFVNQTNGQLNTNASYHSTDYIPVTGNTLYTVTLVQNNQPYTGTGTGDIRLAFYDCDKVFISGSQGALVNTSPEKGAYCRLSVVVNITPQLFAGERTPGIVKYDVKLNEELLPVETVTFRNALMPTVNLAGPMHRLETTYVNQGTGAYHTGTEGASYYTCYKEMPIEGGKTYQIGRWKDGQYNANTETRTAFYDANKKFITGAMGETTIVAPDDACYLSVSYSNPYLDIQLMVCEGDELKPYEDFKGYINPGYINIATGEHEVFINLPAKVTALVGEELNIYFDNIIPGSDKDYDFDVTCGIGMHLENGYRVTPTASQVGERTLTITATHKATGATTTRSTILAVVPTTAGAGVSKSVIVLGDSTTAYGQVIEKLNENFSGDSMNITTLGTCGTGANKHEGRSGFRFDHFESNALANPFHNPETGGFDANYYFTTTGVAKPDYFIINLGINDAFGWAKDSSMESGVDGIIERCDGVVESLFNTCPDTKICIALTIPPSYHQDAFGQDYGCEQNRNRCKRNNAHLVKALIEHYDNRTDDGIYVIPINTNLDTRHNMGSTEKQVNKRNTTTATYPVGSSGVHPATPGYWQIADVYWFFLKGMEV